MTQDNETKFEAAIDLATALLMDRGMHPIEMAKVLKRKAEELSGEAK
jgi:hypothetical protein